MLRNGQTRLRDRASARARSDSQLDSVCETDREERESGRRLPKASVQQWITAKLKDELNHHSPNHLPLQREECGRQGGHAQHSEQGQGLLKKEYCRGFEGECFVRRFEKRELRD